MGAMRNVYKIMDRKPEWKKRPGCRWAMILK
jgi:hypothetical protein